MNDWATDINTGHLDPRFIKIMKVVDEVEKTIPEAQRVQFYNDLEFTMEQRFEQWGGRRRRKFLGIF